MEITIQRAETNLTLRNYQVLPHTDEILWFTFHDDKIHTKTFADRLQIQVACQIFAFDYTPEELISNTIFIHFKLPNRGNDGFFDVKAE